MATNRRANAWPGQDDKPSETVKLDATGVPPQITPLSRELPAQMENFKEKSSLNLAKILEQRTWENGQLRQDLLYQQRKNRASMYLLEEVRRVTESLQLVLVNFEKLGRETEEESSQDAIGTPERHK